MESTVTQQYLFHIRPSEAHAIVLYWLTPDGRNVVSEIVGGKSDVGQSLWFALKQAGFIKAQGVKGQYTPSSVNQALFAQTRFVEVRESLKQFSGPRKRFQEFLPDQRREVSTGAFIDNLKAIAQSHPKEPSGVETVSPQKGSAEGVDAQTPAVPRGVGEQSDARAGRIDEIMEQLEEVEELSATIEQEILALDNQRAHLLVELDAQRQRKTLELGRAKGRTDI